MPSAAFEELKLFITDRMRMAHIYQPVMLKVLLENGGQASRNAIAQAFLNEDRSQVEYYETITRNMPGRVLAKHGIVERVGGDYRLTDRLSGLSYDERLSLIGECDTRLNDYLEQRSLAPWQHRKKAAGYVPGSLRYDIIRRAMGRCEACGVSSEERALEVDHIIPRNHGGTNEHSNLQVLCYLCNAQKRDRDSTDFAFVKASYDDRVSPCLFCDLPPERIIAEDELVRVIWDNYPVTKGHRLIIPRRHFADYFDLHQPERNAIERMLHRCRDDLMADDKSIDGFNMGVNSGQSAGQTIFHVHVHLIPRRTGDMDNPRGGVRGVIPDKRIY